MYVTMVKMLLICGVIRKLFNCCRIYARSILLDPFRTFIC